MEKISLKEDKIINEIEELRKKMEEEAKRLGLNHQKVLKISQKIDQLHTKLLIIQKNKNEKQDKITYTQKKNDDYFRETSNLLIKNIA